MITRAELNTEFAALAAGQYLHIDVLGEGPTNAHVAVIGEGPGETEVRTGSPFTGGSGKLLWDSLRPLGLHRANLYVTNVVKRQISLSRKGDERHVVHRDELNKWIGLLKWELEQLPNVRIVFVLGNYALEALTGQDITRTRVLTGITNWRGSILDGVLPNGNQGKLVLTINPAYAQRELKMEPMFKMDCAKLRMVVDGSYKPYEVEEIINPSFKQAKDYIRGLIAAKKPVAYDIETSNGEVACFGLSNDPHVGMCINLRDHVQNRFSLSEETDLHYLMQDLFDTCNTCYNSWNEKPNYDRPPMLLIAQNGGFDSYYTWLRNYIRPTVHFDTLLAHHTLYPQLPHTLAFQVAQYTVHPFYKDEGEYWRDNTGDIDTWWRYNCKDDALTVAVFQREWKELQQQRLFDFFRTHVMRLQPHLVSSTVHGIAVDLEAKKQAIETAAEDIEQLREEFFERVKEATGNDDYYPNPASHQQMAVLLFDILGVKGRGRSVDETNRERIKKHSDTPVEVKELLTAYDRLTKESKFFNTFASVRLTPEDNRFRFDNKQYGVMKAPGRLSTSQLKAGWMEPIGMNVQNQPPRARSMYVADEGCRLIYFDASQAEARVVAYRANIPVWKEQFERARIDGSYDCHRALASQMFKIPYDEVPKKDTYFDDDGREQYTKRYVAKRCRHGLNYRMQVERLSEVTKLPYFEARRAFTLYHQLTPQLKRWWAQAESDFRKIREAYNAFGRRLKVIQRIDDEVLESIVAFYPQSTIGDHICRVWYRSVEDSKWPSKHVRIAINVHDSLTGIAVLVPNRVAKTALGIMKKYAEEPILIQDAWYGKTEKLIIPAETKMSTDVIKDRNGKVIGTDKYHRWSNMETVHV